MSTKERNSLTSEFIESANITISQPSKGYRYGEEAIELANLCKCERSDKLVDLGCGSGIIGLIISARDNPTETILIERQKNLSLVGDFNIKKNNIKNTKCILGDYRTISKKFEGYFDKAVSNPPFTPKGEGQTCATNERMNARMENHGTLKELIKTAHDILKPNGIFWIVVPNNRSSEIKEYSKDLFVISEQKQINTLTYTKLLNLGSGLRHLQTQVTQA